ncbi:helix-turn-helix transcriptional regulator [Aquitalea palustris]|uniref:Helix-turn-helix transcriptional regulator n=2 Tax=Aquitalea palustris TaxID=2480983 RepID=A0A454JK83_9NEIS|nr:helix-turn-helix transcriptional regulator [Aquitalea palustris]
MSENTTHEESHSSSTVQLACAGFHDRMRLILANHPSEAAFAKAAGLSQSGFNRLMRQGGFPTLAVLIAIAEASGCNIQWIATGKGPMRDGEERAADACPCNDTLGNPVDLSEFVFIPRYNVKAAAGHGSAIEGEKPMFSMSFRRYWIENYLRVDPKDLSVLSVKGDSMEGVLNDRDVILVNHADRQPTSGLYVLRLDEDLIVKRVQKLPGGKLRILSANEAYDPFEVDVNSPEVDFAVIGRVVWFGRQI